MGGELFTEAEGSLRGRTLSLRRSSAVEAFKLLRERLRCSLPPRSFC